MLPVLDEIKPCVNDDDDDDDEIVLRGAPLNSRVARWTELDIVRASVAAEPEHYEATCKVFVLALTSFARQLTSSG